LVSVNSTESATDAVEMGEGGTELICSSPMRCAGSMRDVFSAAWWFVSFVAVVALFAFERLCCSMLQSAQASSSSVVCF
jgi:hypothetical protein